VTEAKAFHFAFPEGLAQIWGHYTSLSFERGNIVENWYGVPRFSKLLGPDPFIILSKV